MQTLEAEPERKVLVPYLEYSARASDAFLRRCATLSITEQLLSRKIDEVLIRVIPDENTPLLAFNTDHHFVAQLDRSLQKPQQALQLGKAIAATFFYNLTYTPPKNLMPDENPVFLQEFQRHFAASWVHAMGYTQITAWLVENDLKSDK